MENFRCEMRRNYGKFWGHLEFDNGNNLFRKKERSREGGREELFFLPLFAISKSLNTRRASKKSN